MAGTGGTKERAKRWVRRLWPVVAGMLLCSCASSPETMEMVEQKYPMRLPQAKPNPREEGSIWRSNGQLTQLFVMPKAREVGDIVTINVVESSSASNNAQTDTSRKSELTASVDGFFGMEKKYPKPNHYFNPFSKIQGGMENAFAGSGTTQRSGKLAASITARVTEVLPNGNLRIVGAREVVVNNEGQIITLSGIIRPRDISDDNVILSTYISDARISYTGKGVVNDKQRPGWMARVLDAVWPF